MAFLLGLEEPGDIFLFLFMVVGTLSMEPPSYQSAKGVACVVTHRHGADQQTLGLMHNRNTTPLSRTPMSPPPAPEKPPCILYLGALDYFSYYLLSQ